MEENLKTKHAINIMNVLENDKILKKLMEYVPFPGIQILRKVSRNIHQHIDRIKLDPEIHECCFDIRGFNMVDVDMKTKKRYDGWTIYYAKRGDGCSVSSCYYQKVDIKPKYLDEDFRIRCLKDFEINMKHRTSGLNVLRFEFSRPGMFHSDKEVYSLISSIYPFLAAFEEFFRTTKTPLKVKRLEMRLIRKRTTSLQQNEVMKVLPFLDSQILETINFSRRYQPKKEQPYLVQVDELSKLEQWMKAKELNMIRCIILTPIQEMNITHFAKGDITVQTISLEDLRTLKEGFQNNSTLMKFKIAFKECTFHEFRNEDVYQFMGIPHIEANPLLRNQRNIWFYRMPNCANILHIVHFVGQYITFAAVEPSKVPESAWIHD